MKHYIDKDALIAEIKRMLDSYHPTEITSGRHALGKMLSFLDTLEVKEVQEETESIWHDANQQPTMYRKYLVRFLGKM